jgi:hypothetical protein
MPNSQFKSPARLQSDGRIVVGGTQNVQPLASSSEVRYHFILVQGDAVAKGEGQGHGSTWSGLTEPNQPPLELGRVLAVGVAVQAKGMPEPGLMTFSWSDQIELERQT